jgi:hypothetical protein
MLTFRDYCSAYPNRAESMGNFPGVRWLPLLEAMRA